MATAHFVSRVHNATADRLLASPDAVLVHDALTEIVFTEAWSMADQDHDVYGHELARAALAALPVAPAGSTRRQYAALIHALTAATPVWHAA